MKVALVQQASGDWSPMLAAMIPHHLKYCERHGIVYLPSFGRIDESKHPNFDRLPLLIETLRAGFADIVVWLDADCVIANPNVSLVEAADEFMLLGLVAHPDPFSDWGFHYNNGAMYLRNTPRLIQFLEIVQKTGQIPGEKWFDQGTVLRVAEKMKFPICRLRHRWNSTPAYNDCPNPIVKAWHGHNGLRCSSLNQITDEMLACVRQAEASNLLA